MKRELSARGIGIGLLAALVAYLGLHLQRGGAAPEARADEAAPAPVGVTGPGCKIKGVAPMVKGAQLFDAASAGRVIATFTGALVPLALTEIPADPTQGRAKLSTSDGGAALRLDGYIAPSEVQVYTTRDIPVINAHVWISSAQKVKLVGATADTLRAELAVAGSEGQTARGSAPCDAFSLQRGAQVPMDIGGSARGFLMKRSSIDLHAAPNGDVIFSLKMIEGSSQLFWSTESRGGFVHVVSRGDLTLDAWARWGDLKALKKGEMRDQYIPPYTAVAGAQLTLDQAPPLVKATRDLPIRARRDAKEAPIGVLEAGAEVYLLETVAGWTNLLPKSLGMTPPDAGGFWIPSAEAPK